MTRSNFLSLFCIPVLALSCISLPAQTQYGTTAPTTSCANIINQKGGSTLNLNSPIAGVNRVTISLTKDVNAGSLCFSLVSGSAASSVCDSIPGNPLLLLNLDYSGDLSQDSINSTVFQTNFSEASNLQAGFCRSPFVTTPITSSGSGNYTSTIAGSGVQVYAVTGNLTTVRTGLEQYNWWPVVIISSVILLGGIYTGIAYKMRRVDYF